MKTLFFAALSIGLLAGCSDQEKITSLEAENQALKVKLASYEPAQQPTLEYKVAVLAAGGAIPGNDSSVLRARYLLDLASKQYGITQDEAADMALSAAERLKKEKVNGTLMDILEGVTIYGAVDGRQWKKDKQEYASFATAYVMSRVGSNLSHEESVRSVIALQSNAINLGANRFDQLIGK